LKNISKKAAEKQKSLRCYSAGICMGTFFCILDQRRGLPVKCQRTQHWQKIVGGNFLVDLMNLARGMIREALGQ
jgi:hypothetical protein